jgi:transglutaminase-like putative cysteine protease
MASGERAQLVAFSTHQDKVRFFAALAHEHSRDQDIQALARSIVAYSPDKSELGRILALHGWVAQNVQHIGEPIETVPNARQVAIDGCGDCDDSAVLLMALLLAIGHRACLLPMGDPPRHVCAGVWYDGQWHPLETTIEALPGEHPMAAADRLGMTNRKDLR